VAAPAGDDNRNSLHGVELTLDRGTRSTLAVGAAAAVACAYVAIVDPSRPGRLPTIPCPFHAATGLWCPGCGMTRAFHDVLTGHPMAAFGANILWPLLVVVAGWLFVSRLSRRVPRLTRAPAAVWVALVVGVLAFGVARNLPAFAALAP